MSAETMVPELAVGWAQALADVAQRGKVEAWTAVERTAALFACEHVRELLAMARRSVEERLAQGVEARAFASELERMVAGLAAVAATAQQVADTWPRQPVLDPLLPNYRSFINDVRSLHQFLGEAVAQAKRPAAPVDWNRIKDAEAAYSRGETKPFQRTAHG